MSKYRCLVQNLQTNPSLQERVVGGLVGPAALVDMQVQDYAGEDLLPTSPLVNRSRKVTAPGLTSPQGGQGGGGRGGGAGRSGRRRGAQPAGGAGHRLQGSRLQSLHQGLQVCCSVEPPQGLCPHRQRSNCLPKM